MSRKAKKKKTFRDDPTFEQIRNDVHQMAEKLYQDYYLLSATGLEKNKTLKHLVWMACCSLGTTKKILETMRESND